MAGKKKAKGAGGRKKSGGFFDGKIFPVKQVIVLLVCAVIIAGAVYGVRYFFLKSDFFTIKEIAVNRAHNYPFQAGEKRLKNLYLGRNMFSVDLRQVQTLIINEFPQLSKVEVRRKFPNRLEIDIIGRSPVAVIDSAGGIIIDREGVVLNIGMEQRGLIKIKGISFFLSRPSRGEKMRNQTIDEVLVLLEGLRRKMGKYKEDIEYIDVSSRDNIVIGIRGVSVKIGSGDFSRKIDKLREIVGDPDIDMGDIKYIDLRFEDAVISPK
ncbi:MAG: cell division protein FtsQ/DivIB [Candidatus Omnitrophota bacterium]|nr:cell division protein FtsQ/DivIB [Candidatus Omnitrophota bacterium]